MNAKKNIAAVIDVGSHETSLRIARLVRGSAPVLIDEVSRTIPVGVDTFTTGKISQVNLTQIVDVLNDFKDKLKDYRVTTFRAFAASAFREATNGSYAIEQIFIRTGIRVEILSNSMDNKYIQIAISEGLPGFAVLADQGCVILVIGSGSIQLTQYHGGQYINSQHFRLGVLRVRELLGSLERVSPDFNALLAEYISGALNYYRAINSRQSDFQNLIVIGGSLRYMKYVAKWDLADGETISIGDFLALLERLKTRERRILARVAQIPTEHESLLIPGGVVMEEVLAFTGVEKFYMPNLDLIDGVLFEMSHEYYRTKFIRDPYKNMEEAAHHLARRYRTDKFHVRHVQKLAERLFDLTEKFHNLGVTERRYLSLAAILHNIGKYVSMYDDGIRAFNIINSAELIGLDDAEKEMVALIACFHNGHVNYDEPMLSRFTEAERIVILKLTAILAVANSLDAGHKQKLEILSAKTANDKFLLTVSANRDATIENWNFSHHTALFADLFGYKPVLRVRRTL